MIAMIFYKNLFFAVFQVTCTTRIIHFTRVRVIFAITCLAWMSSTDETIPPERRSFPGRSFYGRWNNSVVISRGFGKTQPSVDDFLKPGVILVCFISRDSHKPTTEWDVILSRYATRTATINGQFIQSDFSRIIGCDILSLKLIKRKIILQSFY